MFALPVIAFLFFAVFHAILALPVGIGDSDEVGKPRILSQIDLLKDAKSFPCQPQKRSFLVKDLLTEANILLETTENIHVYSIPLYRCDQQSGCCIQRPGQVCAESGRESVVVQLIAIKTNDGSRRTIDIENFNHTKCACQNIGEIKRKNTFEISFVHSLTSAGLTFNGNDVLLCVALLFYFIYLL